MTETLYGDWFVRCAALSFDWDVRFITSGSESSDGVYPAIPGTEIARVSGREWSIGIEWNKDSDRSPEARLSPLGWQPSFTRSLVTYSISEGLVIEIGASHETEFRHDFDYVESIFICKSLDQTINPKPPDISSTFTISQNRIR